MEINIKKEIDELLKATVTNNMTKITKQKQIINAFFRIIQIDAIEGTNTKNKGYDVILIDDYMFKVLSWFYSDLISYPLINIKSINIINQEITYFSVYTSNSEVGIFRLVAASMSSSKPPTADFFYKGKDYVQQTMINLNLQIFIYKNFIQEYKNLTNTQYYIDNRSVANYKPSDNSLTSEQISLTCRHIDDESRQIEVEPFNTFNKDIRKSCMAPDKDSDKPELDEITARLNELSNQLEQILNITNIKYIGNINISDRNTILNLQNDIYNLSPPLKIFKITFHNGIVLYYCVFKFGSDEYFSPITLITKEAKITKYGTYSQYIPSGYYICKPYNYFSQVTKSEKKLTKYRISNYVFIADRYTNLYPYTKHNTIGHECSSCTYLNVPGASKCDICLSDI